MNFTSISASVSCCFIQHNAKGFPRSPAFFFKKKTLSTCYAVFILVVMQHKKTLCMLLKTFFFKKIKKTFFLKYCMTQKNMIHVLCSIHSCCDATLSVCVCVCVCVCMCVCVCVCVCVIYIHTYIHGATDHRRRCILYHIYIFICACII